MRGAIDAVLRRLLDVLGATVTGLGLAPVWGLIALAVRVTSGRPVLFAQTRIGRDGRPFQLLKFRTMVVDAPRRGLAITAAHDPRITPVGRLLRRTKLDELPQLLNVLRGEMSLVGPRPEVPRYVARYDADQRRVLAVRPGLTDPATLAYRDEEVVLAGVADPEALYVRDVLPRKLALSLAYLDRRTVWSDLAVLLRTAFRVVIHQRGQVA